MATGDDRPSTAPQAPAGPAALRRCPGCRNLVTTRTPRCPVCGKHATAARVASAVRWLVIFATAMALVWWWHRHV